jgi:predicted acylesterase/phospholipase RssA
VPIPVPFPHIPAEDVSYLSFQGGGAKGAAYLGALTALAQADIFSRIDADKKKFPRAKFDWVLGNFVKGRANRKIAGISGASAGAITAVLVACGYSIREVFEFVAGRSSPILQFYDKPVVADSGGKKYRQVPKVKIGKTNSASASCENREMPSALQEMWGVDGDLLTRNLLRGLGLFSPSPLAAAVIDWAAGNLPAALASRIESGYDDYLRNLILDYGAFSGAVARRTFDQMIGDGLAKITGQSPTQYGVTFNDFASALSSIGTVLDLSLTGTNLTTGESVYFSQKRTPSFKVVDALRISMSFPGAFKPVVIGKGDVGDRSLEGTWIDGGLLNNNPIHAFDDPPPTINRGLLGLRLSSRNMVDINDVAEFVGAIFGRLLEASDIGQIKTPEEEAHTIPLNPCRLSVLDFGPADWVVSEAIYRANEDVLNWFGKGVSTDIVDSVTGTRGPIPRPPGVPPLGPSDIPASLLTVPPRF